MITEFRAKNYGCLRDIQLELTPFHALIGPNDSGKSAMLRAIRSVGEIAMAGLTEATFEAGLPRGQKAASDDKPFQVAATTNSGTYEVSVDSNGLKHRVSAGGKEVSDGPEWNWRPTPKGGLWTIASDIVGARLVRFDPDALRQASSLLPQSRSIGFVDERGSGLPGVLQAVQGRYYDAFQIINEQVRKLFPTIKYVQVVAITHSQLVIETELANGTRVPAAQVSEGLLYYLAFASIPHLAPTPILLVEEPENGLHPSRIATVIKMLREFGKSSGTQIILATHSPLVVNELQPEEVTIVTRPSVETGSVVTPMTKTRNFEKRKSAYSLGELWLAYADGNLESDLVDTSES